MNRPQLKPIFKFSTHECRFFFFQFGFVGIKKKFFSFDFLTDAL